MARYCFGEERKQGERGMTGVGKMWVGLATAYLSTSSVAQQKQHGERKVYKRRKKEWRSILHVIQAPPPHVLYVNVLTPGLAGEGGDLPMLSVHTLYTNERQDGINWEVSCWKLWLLNQGGMLKFPGGNYKRPQMATVLAKTRSEHLTDTSLNC